jgi:hypothetical protein
MLHRCLRASTRPCSIDSVRFASITTLADIGIESFRNTPVRLLPLFRSKESRRGHPSQSRIKRAGLDGLSDRVAFNTRDGTEWLSTLHVFPSAYPRSHPASTSPPSEGLPKLLTQRATFDKAKEKVARQDDFAEWERIAGLHSIESFYPPSTDQEAQEMAERMTTGEQKQPQLWSVVQRLAPKHPKEDGITLITAHANGFHKEVRKYVLQ